MHVYCNIVYSFSRLTVRTVVKMKATLCFVLVCFVVAGSMKVAYPMIVGGYYDREINDSEVQEGAAFAAEEMEYQLLEIVAAQSQVC